MKNKFLHGAAALALCAGFVACSEYDAGVAPETLADIKSLQYETAFVQKFGKIDPTQDWGFGSGMETRAENANANEWADATNSTGYGGWVVPDPLTEGQKLRVQLYFQANPNLTYEDPHWENFFVQQVYTGSTAPGQYSAEVVAAADGIARYTGHDIDLMTVGQNNVHINNFNGGTAETVTVLDNGGNVNDGPFHSDQIMLMVDIDDTSCFGYLALDGKVQRNNKAALVSAAVIDAWAAANGNPGEPVVDKWNRSFLGFDLELRMAADMTDNGFATYQAGVEQPCYLWDGTNVIEVAVCNESTSWAKVPVEGYEYLKGTDGSWLPFVTTNKNEFAASYHVTLTQDDVRVRKQYYDKQNGWETSVACLNMEKIQPLIDQGYLPVKDKQLCEWVKIEGGDGYYSDWIVTLCEAKRIDGGNDNKNDGIVAQGRVFCEDLGSIGDFDFNDVVFDAYIYESGKVEITLLAAGGTLPITVAGVNPHAHLGEGMVNTGVGGDGRTYTIKLSKEEAENLGITVAGGLNSIPVVVSQVDPAGYNVNILLNTETGKAPQKICVPVGTRWMLEYEKINNGYPKFEEWVSDSSVGEKAFTEDVKSEYLY